MTKRSADAFWMGVGEYYLTETIAADDLEECFHAVLVEFFEDVIK